MNRSPRWSRAGLVPLLLVVGLGVGSTPANAADNGAWSAVPAVKGQQAPRQYVFVDGAGGQKVRDSITLSNFTSEPLILDVFPSDAYNISDGGGFAVTDKGAPLKDVGAWTTVSTKRVTIPPATTAADGDTVPGTRDVSFTIAIPKGATPGDHAGALTTLEGIPEPIGNQSQVLVRRQLAVRIYVRVDGPLTTQIVVERVQLTAQPARLPFIGRQGAAIVDYSIRNVGNTRVTPDRTVELQGLFGQTLHAAPLAPSTELLPGSVVVLRESFAGMPVLNRVTATVELRSPDGKASSVGDTTEWVVSLTFLLLLLLFLLLVGAYMWFRGRAKQRSEAPDSDRINLDESTTSVV